MSSVAERIFTVPEVAFVADVSDKVVQREIDAGIVDALPDEEARTVGFPDVLYLAVVRTCGPVSRPRFALTSAAELPRH